MMQEREGITAELSPYEGEQKDKIVPNKPVGGYTLS